MNPVQTSHSWLHRIRPAFIASALKRVLRIRRRLAETRAGLLYVDPVSNFGRQVLSPRGYEPQMVSTLEGVLEEGDVFVDVGANEGFFSVLASRLVGTTGRVVSIEPQSRLQNVLQMNLLANGASNVLVLQRLISDEDGIARLWLSPDMNPGSSGLFLNTRYPTRYEMVPQVTLVHLIESLRLDKIKLLKIDIEGYEYEAILGSRSLFEQTVIDYVALELHPTLLKRRGKSQDEVLRFLAESGYKTIDGYSNLVLRKLGA